MGVQYQLPLIGPGPKTTSDNLAFPHCPGIFDWTVNQYLPVMLPELTFGKDVVIPSFYGKNCVTGIGLKKSLYLRFNQPELVRTDGTFANGIGQCQVQWTFGNGKVTSEFVFQVKNPISCDRMRLALVIGVPHSSTVWAPLSGMGRKACGPMRKWMTFRQAGRHLKLFPTTPNTVGILENVHYISIWPVTMH